MRRLPPDNVGYAAATQLEGSVQGPSSRMCGEVKDHPRDILRNSDLESLWVHIRMFTDYGLSRRGVVTACEYAAALPSPYNESTPF